MDFVRDPQESYPEIAKLIRQAEREALEDLRDEPRVAGFCHLLWLRQKEILQQRYGIDWKSPTDMNPNVLFD